MKSDPGSPSARERPAGPARFVLALCLAVLTFALYRPALENGFVDYDDGAYVTQNPEVAAGLTVDGVRWAFLTAHSSNWHPLTWMSHMLDVEIHGLDPRGHHLTSVLLFSLSAGLCLLAFHALTANLLGSLAVAALFAAHPLRVESVAWIAERKDVLSGLFFFLILWCHARRARASTAAAARRAALLTGLFLFLGLLAKQMLVTVPFLLLLLDLGPLRRLARSAPTDPLKRASDAPGTPTSLRALLLEKLPLLGLCLAAGIATIFAQRAGGAIRSFEAIPVGVRLSNAVLAYAGYLGKALLPTNLSVFYPHPWLVAPETVSVLGTSVLLAGAGLVALSVLAFLLRRRGPWILAGWLWYLGMALPVIGVLQVGAQWMADRYAYLPHLGLYAALVFGVGGLFRSERARTAVAGLALLAAAACVPLTRSEIAVWHDTRSLFETALAHTDRNYLAHVNLGYIEHREGNLDAAEAHYRAALAIAPRMSDTHTNLAGILFARGDIGGARSELDAALGIDSTFVNAWLLRAVLEENEGDFAAALADRRRAVEADPSSVSAGVELGSALLEAGRADEALALLRPLVATHPNHLDARVALARAEAATGEVRAALADLERAEHRGSAEATTELVWLLATSPDAGVRDPARAVTLARAVENPDWRGLRALAAALAAGGDREGAKSVLLDAAAAAPPARTPELMELRGRIERGEPLDAGGPAPRREAGAR